MTAPVELFTVQTLVSADVYVTLKPLVAVAATVVVPPAGRGLAEVDHEILCAVLAVEVRATQPPVVCEV